MTERFFALAECHDGRFHVNHMRTLSNVNELLLDEPESPNTFVVECIGEAIKPRFVALQDRSGWSRLN